MLETLHAGRSERHTSVRGIDLETLADRLCQVLLHVSLGVFDEVRGADEVPAIRCRTLLDGVAVDPPDNAALDRSRPFEAATRTIEEWDKGEEEEDERLPMLRAVAASEFGGKGYEATTVRDIAAAAGLSIGSVYRLIGSKDELLASIMRSFTDQGAIGLERRAAGRRDGCREARRADVDQHQRRRPVQRRVQHPARVAPRVAADHDEPGIVVHGARCATSSRSWRRAPVGRAPRGRTVGRHPGVVAVRAAVDAREHRAQARPARRAGARPRHDAAWRGAAR